MVAVAIQSRDRREGIFSIGCSTPREVRGCEQRIHHRVVNDLLVDHDMIMSKGLRTGAGPRA